MLYYAAPMEGFTDRVWRQTHQKWFGAQGAADRYYAPFISPPERQTRVRRSSRSCWQKTANWLHG